MSEGWIKITDGKAPEGINPQAKILLERRYGGVSYHDFEFFSSYWEYFVGLKYKVFSGKYIYVLPKSPEYTCFSLNFILQDEDVFWSTTEFERGADEFYKCPREVFDAIMSKYSLLKTNYSAVEINGDV